MQTLAVVGIAAAKGGHTRLVNILTAHSPRKTWKADLGNRLKLRRSVCTSSILVGLTIRATTSTTAISAEAVAAAQTIAIHVRDLDPRDVFMSQVDLPRGLEREHVLSTTTPKGCAAPRAAR